ncbi:MAG: hypothetical protein HDS70_05130 [Bacteroidales bacterium]|nr:hypothetical protein [Bacteroidales bacterium]
MKKRILMPLMSVCLAASGIALVSCGGKTDKVKAFAVDFATKAGKNQLDSLKLLYPSLDADSVALAFSADSITIADGAEPDNFIVNLGNSASVNVVVAEDGTISATSSKGLYAFKDADLSFAKSIGMYDASFDDKALRKRLSEIPDVKAYLTEDYAATHKKDLAVTSSVTGHAAGYMTLRNLHIKVTNKGNVPVKGSDYTVNYRAAWMDFGQPMSRSYSAPGKDVPVGGSVTITKTITGMGGVTGISWKNKDAAFDFDKDFKPTGKEYQTYLDSKKESGK